MDEIRIDNLEVFAYHGMFPEEQENGQRFYVNAVLYLDLWRAGKTDDLDASVDYGRACHEITEILQESKNYTIEKVAEEVADRLLLRHPVLRGISVEIRKPQAPIGLPFESVSVKVCRSWHKVFLSLGSNMGDKEKYLRSAIESLKALSYVRNVKVSSFLETKPYGGVEQDDFLNAAAYLETLEDPVSLLEDLHRIEADAHRTREIHWGPRTLDLDVLFYDKLVYEDDDLIIPHVDLQNREFVLQPLCEIAPNYRHPILGKTVRQMLEELQNRKA